MAQDLTGKIVDRYQVIERIGVGGMAVVYRAQQMNMARMVALKVMDTLLVHDPDFVARFQRESDIIARLEHPHILPVYDYGHDEANGLIYLVTRLMTGGSLQDRLGPQPMPLERARVIMQQLGSALDYAHERGVIHRDLKPSNVLLDEFGNIYLTDFGIAKLRYGTLITHSGAALGTPLYMSPEQWHGVGIDGRADVYALGIVLYQMLSGEPPFFAPTPPQLMYLHLEKPPPPLVEKVSGLPRGIQRVIEKALAKNPEDRFASAGAMVRAFEDAAQGKPLQIEEVVPAPLGRIPAGRVSSPTPVLADPPETLLLDGQAGGGAAQAFAATSDGPSAAAARRRSPLTQLLLLTGLLAVIVLASLGIVALIGQADAARLAALIATPTGTSTASATVTPTTALAVALLPGDGATLTPTPSASPSATATATDTPPPLPCRVYTDNTRGVQVRVGPGTNRASVAYLPAGIEVSVLGQASAADGSIWWRVRLDGWPQAWILPGRDMDMRGACDLVGIIPTPPIIPINRTISPADLTAIQDGVQTDTPTPFLFELTPTDPPFSAPTAGSSSGGGFGPPPSPFSPPTVAPTRTPSRTPLPSSTPPPTDTNTPIPTATPSATSLPTSTVPPTDTDAPPSNTPEPTETLTP